MEVDSIGLYLHQINRIPLVSYAAQRDFCMRADEAKVLLLAEMAEYDEFYSIMRELKDSSELHKRPGSKVKSRVGLNRRLENLTRLAENGEQHRAGSGLVELLQPADLNNVFDAFEASQGDSDLEWFYDGVDDVDHHRSKLVKHNLRYVIGRAKKYRHNGVPFLDLIQEGNGGMITASKKFDYKKGFTFLTYASWWIRQAVTKSLANHSKDVRLPVNVASLLPKIFNFEQNSHGLTEEDYEKEFKMPYKKIMQIREKGIQFSLETPVGDNGGTVGDFFESDYDLAQRIREQEYKRLIPIVFQLAELDRREIKILKDRNGLNPTREIRSLQEVGEEIGVTRERVRQIEARALLRLRKRASSFLIGRLGALSRMDGYVF